MNELSYILTCLSNMNYMVDKLHTYLKLIIEAIGQSVAEKLQNMENMKLKKMLRSG